MREEFVGYIPYSKLEFKKLWKEATFVFDANILLNLYRYSEDTKNDVLNSIENLKERVWIPYNICEEFFRNRTNTITEQNRIPEVLKKDISFDKEIKAIENLRHSSLDKHKREMLELIEKCKSKIVLIIEKYTESVIDFENDEILKKVLSIFENKVGKSLEEEKLKSYKKLIDVRYENKIPPGYKDIDKGENRKYGDCIIWFELLEYAKKNDKDIIFVSDDEKEDWIEIIKGEKKGPRKELLNEFYKKTGKRIYIYNTERFLQEYSINIENKQSSKASIDEIKLLKELNYKKRARNNRELQLLKRESDDEYNKKLEYMRYMSDNIKLDRLKEHMNYYENEKLSIYDKEKDQLNLYDYFIRNIRKIRYNLRNNREAFEDIYDRELISFLLGDREILNSIMGENIDIEYMYMKYLRSKEKIMESIY